MHFLTLSCVLILDVVVPLMLRFRFMFRFSGFSGVGLGGVGGWGGANNGLWPSFLQRY